jgi:hypothetical protein
MMNSKRDKWQRGAKRWGMAGLIAVLLATFVPTIQAADTTGVEDGAIKQHELFEFESFIKHDGIVDGTAPFDADDEAGNDSSKNNGIIRTFDTATYPIKITINPKNVDKLENIKLKITGYVENGVTNGRVNASFAVGGSENVKEESVTFEQEYTIQQTGNSVMLPVALNIQGAENGTVLKPHLKVQVVSVDGKDITADNIIQEFDSLPTLTTSGKVSLGAVLRNAGGGDVSYASNFLKDVSPDDDLIINKVGMAIYAKNLPGRSDARGTTFPSGEIDFSIDVSGYVYWDKTKQTTNLDFENKDKPVELFDLQLIDWNKGSYIGNENTLMGGKSYSKSTGYSGVPQSKMSNIHDMNVVRKEQDYKVWDSGNYRLDKVNTNNKNVSQTTGSITDYIIGSTFPVKESPTDIASFGNGYKIFSTRNINLATPTEYKVGGIYNQAGDTNNMYYDVTAKIHSYVDSNGKKHELNETSNTYRYNQRNGIGSMSTSLKFWSDTGKPLGTVARSNSYAPYGDESILKGQNVQSRYRAANYSANMDGGMITIIKWNIDSFELTRADANQLYIQYLQAKIRTWKSGSTDTVTQQLGVPKNSDMSFQKYLSYDIDDYDWFNTYDEAIRNGRIGAVKYDIKDAIEVGATIMSGNVPLTVTTNKVIGSLNAKGTPNISTQITYGYYDQARTLISKILDTRYTSYTAYDENGYIASPQRPVGGDVSFDTLGVINGNVSNKITSDQDTYYTSDAIKWKVESDLVIPDTTSTDAIGGSVFIEQVLPKGLMYKVNSATVGSKKVDPKIIQNSNGTTSLIFEVMLSTNSTNIDDIQYETVINPREILDGVRADLTVNSVISSSIDTRAVAFRTSSKTVNVIKVGMVGIFESIDKIDGGKNSDFTITLSPYTTIEDETGVTGLTVIPLSGDDLGSNYTGSATIKEISTIVERTHDDPVKIYLNKNPVYSDRPHEIDTSKDGWYEYTGQQGQLDDAVSLLFHVEGLMTNKDDIEIKLTIQTRDNHFGDTYLNETVINSDTDYRLSPVSNRVRYAIRADLELALERFRIYTDKADSGLPTSIRVKQSVFNQSGVEDLPITLAIYDTETGDKVAEKTYKQHELEQENEIKIPADGLQKATHKNYEVRLEGYDENKVWVRNGEDRINTDGYTAEEKTLTTSDADANGNVKFTGVVMTERELGKGMVKYNETFTVPRIEEPEVKSGYGFNVNGKITYSNDIMNDIQSRLGVPYAVDASLIVDNRLIDSSLEYYDKDAETSVVPMEQADASSGAHVTTTYQLPSFYLEQKTGLTYSANQKENGQMSHQAIDAGHRLFVPVWIQNTGAYDIGFKTDDSLGVNRINVNLLRHVNVEAYMFNHTDSKTSEKDELLIHPMLPDDIPENW